MRRLLAAFFATLVAAACGARTGLPVDRPPPGGATRTGGTGGTGGAGGNEGLGGFVILPDAGPADALPDALPDAPVASDCAEAGVTFIYVITAENTLWTFYPPTAQFTPIGTIACPGESTSPFSMGVDRQGIAWVVFSSGNLYRVDTANAQCTATPYAADQLGWVTFGMAFATTLTGPGDTLFVTESSYTQVSKGLGKIDLQTFQLDFLAPVVLPPPPTPSFAVELTGTGDGRLYGFSLDQPGPGSHVSQIDEVTGAVLDTFALPQVGDAASSFAFAYWGGDFYLFTAAGNTPPTTVTRYVPSTSEVGPVAMLGGAVVGVGVSTCAPE